MVQILSFWHTKFLKHNCLGSQCLPYGKSWIHHWCGLISYCNWWAFYLAGSRYWCSIFSTDWRKTWSGWFLASIHGRIHHLYDKNPKVNKLTLYLNSFNVHKCTTTYTPPSTKIDILTDKHTSDLQQISSVLKWHRVLPSIVIEGRMILPYISQHHWMLDLLTRFKVTSLPFEKEIKLLCVDWLSTRLWSDRTEYKGKFTQETYLCNMYFSISKQKETWMLLGFSVLLSSVTMTFFNNLSTKLSCNFLPKTHWAHQKEIKGNGVMLDVLGFLINQGTQCKTSEKSFNWIGLFFIILNWLFVYFVFHIDVERGYNPETPSNFWYNSKVVPLDDTPT